MTNDPHLLALLATHGTQLQALLPAHLWPLEPFKVEQFGLLTKYTLGEAWPGTWAMLHRFTGRDLGPPHDHPCRMESHGVKGGYVERLHFGPGRTKDVVRPAGGHHLILPETVHEVVDLLEEEAWTLVLAGPVERAWRHYPDPAAIPHSKYHTAASEAAYH